MQKQFKAQHLEPLQDKSKLMKKLEDYKDDIHKCSKCGLCQSVCPVYKETGNDCSVSRGKFIMLNGIIKGDLKLNKNINKYLDMCLKCNACKDFCPSDIDARKIFLTAKIEYFKTCQNSNLIKAFHSKLVFKSFLNIVKIGSNTYRLLKIDKIAEKFYPVLYKMGWLGKKVILANEFVGLPRRHAELDSASYQHSLIEKIPNQVRDDKRVLKVVYFKGCVNEYINPRTKNAAENILKRMGVKILDTHLPLDCCGVPFLSCGNVEQFKKQAIYNLAQIPDDFDYFLTDCASCQNAFAEYKNYIDDEKLVEKIDKILAKSINVNEFILNNIKGIEFKEKTSFTFHKPCHLEETTFLQKLIKKSKNVEYIQMNEFDKCCGFSGEFAIKNPKLSAQISAKKAQNAIDTNADYILTSCPACSLGLTQGLIEIKNKKSPLNLVEFIALAEIIY